MIAIKAPTAVRPFDAATNSVWNTSRSNSYTHEITHLMASLDRWLVQHFLAERSSIEDNTSSASLSMLDMWPHPATYLETFEVPDAPVSTAAIQAQKRAAQRVAKSESTGFKPQTITSAAPATASLSGSATAVQTLRASTGGLSEATVTPPLALGASPQTLRITVLVLLIMLMFTLGFQLLVHQQTPHQEPSFSEFPLSGQGSTTP
jgi:hypothetical protein